MTEISLETIRKRIAEGLEAEAALSLLNDYIAAHPDDADGYLQRGLKYWGMARYSDAINDYYRADNIAPDGKAAQMLKAAKEILDYRNNDLYNP